MRKSSCKNQLKMGKSKNKGKVEEDTKATTRLQKVFTLKLLNRFASKSVKKLDRKLLKSKNLTMVEKWELPNIIGTKKQELLCKIGAKEWKLLNTPRAKR